MSAPVLSADNIVVMRGVARVLDGVSIALARGSRGVLAGPNGAGKTTLLRALAGLIPLRSGTIRTAAGGRPPAIVFEQGGIIGGLTVAENVALPLVRARVPADQLAARLGWALARFDLAPWEHEDAHHASRGLAVRVQLARAALLEPEVILCDAPLDHLDPAAAEEVERLLLRTAAAGTAVLIATNAPERAHRFADQTWILEQGRLQPGVPPPGGRAKE